MRILRAWALSTVTALLAAMGLVTATQTAAHADIACSVTYTPVWDSGGGFGANITITNLGDPVSPWTLRYTWPGTQQVTHGWGGTWTQSGQNVTVTAPSYAPGLATGGTATVGFYGTYTGVNTQPAAYTLNNVPCTGSVPRSVTLTAPAHGQNFAAPATIGLAATTTPAGWAARVDFYSGATLLGSDTTAPYTFTWSAVPAGRYTLSARALDSSGVAYLSNSATVTVTGVVAEPFVVVNPASVNVAVGGPATVSVRLSGPPPIATTVTTTRVSGDPDLTLQSGATLVFTPANWNVPQNVTVAAAATATAGDTAQFFSTAPGYQPGIFTARVI
ncbi:hypothetical protein Aph01nite_22850 [Acrocarpospora phusangensis]|uniref:CBM2 domain-containing protein n=1 Tax=Acrocarpospora phusangensis TaxID=1070424 RepID=A0A919UPV0_9ACTN|nr:cellulose binding domain-containing protein [Acrocarpospora phusangensis]GIH23975.1 hypothetical protein Aph01nite_22850 [Acrocarpospora phusangensis]